MTVAKRRELVDFNIVWEFKIVNTFSPFIKFLIMSYYSDFVWFLKMRINIIRKGSLYQIAIIVYGIAISIR